MDNHLHLPQGCNRYGGKDIAILIGLRGRFVGFVIGNSGLRNSPRSHSTCTEHDGGGTRSTNHLNGTGTTKNSKLLILFMNRFCRAYATHLHFSNCCCQCGVMT